MKEGGLLRAGGWGRPLDRVEFRVGTVRPVGCEPDRTQAGEMVPDGLSKSGVKQDEIVRAVTVCSGSAWFFEGVVGVWGPACMLGVWLPPYGNSIGQFCWTTSLVCRY